METEKFFALLHQDHRFCYPLSEAKADRLLDLLAPEDDAHVLDVASGNGELLLRLMEQYSIQAVALEEDPDLLNEIWNRAAERAPMSELILPEISPQDYDGADAPFAVILCPAALRAYGSLEQALKNLVPLLETPGYLLIGAPYRKTAAAPLPDHAGNVALGEAAGLTPLYILTANDDERDEYEALLWLTAERQTSEQPDDPEIHELRTAVRNRRTRYLQHDRDAQGYGFYLFQNG